MIFHSVQDATLKSGLRLRLGIRPRYYFLILHIHTRMYNFFQQKYVLFFCALSIQNQKFHIFQRVTDILSRLVLNVYLRAKNRFLRSVCFIRKLLSPLIGLRNHLFRKSKICTLFCSRSEKVLKIHGFLQ